MTIYHEIAAERQRQIAKGYDAAHDDDHRLGQIASAAAAHALMASPWLVLAKDVYPWTPDGLSADTAPREHLVMAAAMLVAEIERLDRAE